MADINQTISLGIGSPAGVKEFLTFGLQIGAEVATYLLDVTLTESLTYGVALSESVIYGVTTSEALTYSVSLSEAVRT